jgi:hypothetical protein
MMSVSPVSYKSRTSAASVVILHLSLDCGRMVARATFDSKSGASNFDLLCKFGKLPCFIFFGKVSLCYQYGSIELGLVVTY